MSATTARKRLIWRRKYAGRGAATFLSVLEAFADTKLEQVESGQSIASTSTPTRSVSFFKDEDSSIDSEACLASDLLDLYDEARANLIAAGTANPSDAQIYAEGLLLLAPINVIRSDFSSCFAD